MGQSQDEEIVSKGEFATLCKVSPGRVTQWIASHQISPSALVGEGRSAKIRVRQAQVDLKRSLDPNQMTGNGVRTRIPCGPLVPSPPDPPPQSRKPRPDAPASADDDTGSHDEATAFDLPSERAALTREQRLNWQMRNAERRGELIEASDAERRWSEAIVDIRSTVLGVAGELRILLPHLAANDFDVIDRAYRDALVRAAGGGA